MLSLFTAMVTNAMNTALDGSKCKDISGKEVRVVKSKKKNEFDSVVGVISINLAYQLILIFLWIDDNLVNHGL